MRRSGAPLFRTDHDSNQWDMGRPVAPATCALAVTMFLSVLCSHVPESVLLRLRTRSRQKEPCGHEPDKTDKTRDWQQIRKGGENQTETRQLGDSSHHKAQQHQP